ncbi:Modulator of apoptosis 1 [Merluccius polli]|uniref:Modulator of apoptosis 1 n=1 Tax=Merluccius polli TaxID=89951 RepID=A0AA47PA28_MERPO|nr:Modulator of apoptosis 1 [Merluccius polli]
MRHGSDLYKSRKLLESLSSPAIDIVKHLTPESPLNVYLEILDSAFGTVDDGDDLFAKYLNTMQDNGEKPSAYLQWLQVMLNTTLRRGGVTASDLDRHLLRKFVRGCWDNILIAELQLEQKKQNPPTFAELLLLLRTAEDKRTSKASRMKQHFGISKPRVSSHYQGIHVQSEEDCNPSQPALDHRSEIQDLKKQIADLQSQLTRITQKDSRNAKSAARPVASQTASTHPPAITTPSQRLQPHSRDVNNNTSNRPRPWYCFRCGEDGHIEPQCESEPNPSLVAEKRKQLREKQLTWDIKNGASKPDPLN